MLARARNLNAARVEVSGSTETILSSQHVKTPSSPGQPVKNFPFNDVDAGAGRFLSALAKGNNFTFQTFDDTPAKRKSLAKILHGSFEQHARRLHQLNDQGAGVFVMVNAGNGRGRRTENVKAVRALFVDLDGAPLEPVLNAPIAPHIIVESSPGRWHAYWLVDGVLLSQFTTFQSQLAKRFGADPSVKDLPRVMRIPGFVHHKNGAQQTMLISLREGARITLDAMMTAFGLTPVIPVGERNTTLFNSAQRFKRDGIPKVGAHRRLQNMNVSACETPLGQEEVCTIVENAYSYPSDGFSKVLHAIVDRPEFTALSAAATKLFLYAMRLHRPDKPFALPHPDYAHVRGLTNRQGFRAAIEELLQAGFLVMTRNYIAGLESDTRQCALYRIADRVQTVP